MKKIIYLSKSNPAIYLGLILILFWIFAALNGASLTPFTATEIDNENILTSPGMGGHFLGTDLLGRDVLSRIITGSRSILTVALLTSLLSTSLGILMGFSAGYFGGFIDAIFLRLMDILQAIPSLMFAMVVLGILGNSSIMSLTIMISITYTPATARVARGALLTCKNSEYVEAARLMGESHLSIMFVEILPNTIGPIVVEASARFAYAIMTVASLGFLGVGLQAPTPDWGMMVIENKTAISFAPWAVLYPSLAIASLVTSVSLISDFASKVLLQEN